MRIDDAFARLTEVLRDFFDDDALVARPDLTADQVPGWDSLAQVRLILTLERKLGVAFSASELSHLENVGDLAALISAKA